MAFERVEDTLRLDSRTGLARLAEDTGGFLVEQTNDLSSAFRRIDEDNQFHYLLTYSPKNTAFDGKFRAIQVKVRVRARRSSRARAIAPIRTPRAIDAGSYEIPALALLDRTPLPNAFPVHAAGFSFPDPARPGLTPVLVHVATDALRFDVDRAAVHLRRAGGGCRPHPRRPGTRGAEAQPAVHAVRRREGSGGREERGDPVLPRAGSAAGRLHDGVDRVRRDRAARQRARRHADRAGRGARRPSA